MELDGKVAIVTGASRGVGAATAVALAAAGARVACAARATDAAPMPTPGTLDATVRRIHDAGGDAIAVPTNLAKDDEVVADGRDDDRALRRASTSSSTTPRSRSPGDLELPMKRHDLIFDVNVRAPLIACQEVVPGNEGTRRRHDPQRVVDGRAQLLPGAHGLRDVEDRARAHDRLARDPARGRSASPSTRSGSTSRWRRRGSSRTCPTSTTPTGSRAEVAAEGILWMLRQPPSYTGHNEAMSILREREGIMASQRRAARRARRPARTG